MKLFRSFTVVIILSTFFSAACGNGSVQQSSSSAGALTANNAFNSLVARRFARQTLNSTGAGYLNEFMKPEVRAHLDEEPAGDTDGGYDPSAFDQGASSEQPQSAEPSAENNEESQQQIASAEEPATGGARLDTLKYSWAKKAFGDAVKASPTTSGVIVLYADENYFEIERLMGFVEEGRDRVAEMSAIRGDRIQVVFGGYRAVPQVELWVVPPGSPMPEFKIDDRTKPAGPED